VRTMLALAAAAAVALVACGGDSSDAPDSAFARTGEQPDVPSLSRDPTPVIEALNAEVGGPNGQTRVTDVGIYPGYAVFTAQDPDTPRNLDRYYYDGEFDPPEPVMISATDTPETELFSVGEVNWAAIPGLVQTALDELNLEGGEVTYVGVFRISGVITIQIPVTGTRMSGTLRADAQGNVTEITVN
jgi:hypothetical protein